MLQLGKRKRETVFTAEADCFIQAHFVLIIMREMLNVESRRLCVTMNLLVDNVFNVKTKAKFLFFFDSMYMSVAEIQYFEL